ncbi:hypothetical protein GCM10010969_33750 [Saccharibacillus kuerlensis]|uniref:Uncharacterized protein n=1 Tax=Saccharibacillus kuerlensis TaxID=459527 RepID=A0ABQ2L844_9BACL|nr:hypothetical protein GCM10010969_33750 [Saccharibacillus kuerlensis]
MNVFFRTFGSTDADSQQSGQIFFRLIVGDSAQLGPNETVD